MNGYHHAEIVRHWLDGQPVEYLDNGEWHLLESPDAAHKMPHFYPSTDYRIRCVTRRVRTGVERRFGMLHPVEVMSLKAEAEAMRHPSFVRWTTDWAEQRATLVFESPARITGAAC